jgi:hypothetical protein
MVFFSHSLSHGDDVSRAKFQFMLVMICLKDVSLNIHVERVHNFSKAPHGQCQFLDRLFDVLDVGTHLQDKALKMCNSFRLMIGRH